MMRAVSGHPSSWLDDDRYPGARAAKHLDEGVHAEAINPAADEVTDPRLSDSKETRGLRLGEPPGLDEPGESDHEVGADLEMFRLLAGESQVAKDVAGRPSGSDSNRFLLRCLFVAPSPPTPSPAGGRAVCWSSPARRAGCRPRPRPTRPATRARARAGRDPPGRSSRRCVRPQAPRRSRRPR